MEPNQGLDNVVMPYLDNLSFAVTARWVFPVSGPPIERGVIEVVNGRIAAVHNRQNSRARDLGNVAVIPALVNAHTHLEFSDLTEPIQPALPFTQWIRSLVGVRRARPATATVVQQGLAECRSTGAACVGEIATQDWPAETFQQPGCQVTVFRELIGLLPDRAASQLEVARNWLGNPTALAPNVVRGLSPHAPYSVHPDLYRDLINLAAEHQAPLAVHLAETTAELELLQHGTGEFVEMLQRFNAWDPQAVPRGSRPLDYLAPLAKASKALVIHGNYLTAEEIDWLAEHPQASVIYCPRTHAYFKHPPHPWVQLLERGVSVALGTDSRGSNPDLSLWSEMRYLTRQFPNVDPALILNLGTFAGAKALNRDRELGSIEPGKHANMAVVPLSTSRENDPYQLLFGSASASLLSPFRAADVDPDFDNE